MAEHTIKIPAFKHGSLRMQPQRIIRVNKSFIQEYSYAFDARPKLVTVQTMAAYTSR